MSGREYTRFYVLLTPKNQRQRTEQGLFVASFDLRAHLLVPATALLIEAILLEEKSLHEGIRLPSCPAASELTSSQ